MKITKEQKAALLQWVAAGLPSGEINRKAAAYEPPFTVSRSQVDYYRKTREASVKAISQAEELDALTTGLSIKAVRVSRLQKLAALHEHDLFGDSLWVTDVKAVNGQPVYITRYNQAEVSEYRGILDDIAKELGQRATKQEISGTGGGPVELVHFYIPDNGRPHPGQGGNDGH